MNGNGFDIRLLGTSGIEDHHAHLLRLDYLDRCSFFPLAMTIAPSMRIACG